MKEKESNIEKVKSMQDDLATVGSDKLSEIFDRFEAVDDTKLMNLNSQYLELKENSKYHFIFKGMTEFSGNNGLVRAAKLVDRDGTEFINGSTILVKSLEVVTQIPCLVKIVTKRKEKSKSGVGSYMDMEVKVLPMPVSSKPDIKKDEVEEDLPF